MWSTPVAGRGLEIDTGNCPSAITPSHKLVKVRTFAFEIDHPIDGLGSEFGLTLEVYLSKIVVKPVKFHCSSKALLITVAKLGGRISRIESTTLSPDHRSRILNHQSVSLAE